MMDGETGSRPTFVSKDAYCGECRSTHDMEVCPDCGADIHVGYGLAFGGYGEYKYCEDECGWFWKKTDSGE